MVSTSYRKGYDCKHLCKSWSHCPVDILGLTKSKSIWVTAEGTKLPACVTGATLSFHQVSAGPRALHQHEQTPYLHRMQEALFYVLSACWPVSPSQMPYVEDSPFQSGEHRQPEARNWTGNNDSGGRAGLAQPGWQLHLSGCLSRQTLAQSSVWGLHKTLISKHTAILHHKRCRVG